MQLRSDTGRRVTTILVTLLLTVTMMAPVTAQEAPDAVVVGDLTVEHAVNPLGIDETRPRFGWVLASDRRGVVQSAYQVQVASSVGALAAGAADVWDSGRVASQDSVDVVYDGPALEPRTRYHWRVRVWDGDGAASGWSEPAWWEMGLVDDDAWHADWIGHDIGASLPTSVTDQNTPSQLQAGTTQGQTFVADRAFDRVGGKFPTWGATDSDVTLALRRGGPDGEVVASERFADVDDNAWVELTFDEPLPAGEYLLEHSDPEGTVGWWSHSDDVYAHGTAVVDGEPVAGDRTLRWHPAVVEADGRTPYLRHDFTAAGEITKARLYASALGVYELWLNGDRVGDRLFAPGWTDYRSRVQYQTYDVTDLVTDGANTIGAILSPGWWAGNLSNIGPNQYGTQPWLLAQLEVTFADGSTQVITSDDAWRSSTGPILSSDMQSGEVYDARREMPGWNAPGFDASAWEPVTTKDDVDLAVVAQVGPPVRVVQEIDPVAVTEPEPGTFVFDMGQNMVGNVRLRVDGEAGDRVTLRHAEVLNPDGTIYTANLRSAEATDRYTLAGDGEEVFEPRFTFHGFRYVEVTGYPGTPTLDDVTGRVIHSDAPFTGELTTSNPMVNQLQSNITWGQRGNFLSIPTDTPARDERLGWTGDINVFAGAAAFNMDVRRFLEKWLVDLRDGQRADGAFPDVAPYIQVGFGNAGWGDAGITVPWVLWRRYGDTRAITDNYQAMQGWIAYLQTNSDDLIRPSTAYNDWLNVNDPTPGPLISTAYFAHSTELLSQMAAAIGRDEDAATYAALADEIKAAFVDEFVDADGRIGSGSQTGYVLALSMDLLPESLRAAAAQHLVDAIAARDWHLSTGFLGTRDLLPVLAETGHVEVAYRLLLNDTYPSWGYQIDRGATTMWEHWDSIKPDGTFENPAMNSFNHYAYGAVGDWLYQDVAGLQPAEPGYRHSRIRPVPGGDLTAAEGSLETVYGTLSSAWRDEGSRFSLDVTVPANTTATVHVPAVNRWAVNESGGPAAAAVGVTFERMEDGYAVYRVGSGTYAFRSDDVAGWLGAASAAAGDVLAAIDADEVPRGFAAATRAHSRRLADALDDVTTAHADGDAAAAGRAVAAALRAVAHVRHRVEAAGDLPPDVADGLRTALDDAERALSAASGTLLGAAATLAPETEEVIAGGTVRVTATLRNTGDETLTDVKAALDLADGWTAEPVDVGVRAPLRPGEERTLAFDVTAAADAPVASDVVLAGEVTYRTRGAVTRLPVSTLVDVESPVAVSAAADPRLLAAPGDSTTLSVTVTNRRDTAVEGSVAATAPGGWTIEPATLPYSLDGGAQTTVTFTVTSPEEPAAADLSVEVRYGDEVGAVTTARVTALLARWSFDTDGDAEGWSPANHLADLVVADGALSVTSTGGDPYLLQTDTLNLDASDGAVVEITMQASTSSDAQLFWGTAAAPGFAEARSTRFAVEAGDPRTYAVEIPPQDSPVTHLRIDPLTVPGDIAIDAIAVVR